MSLQRRQFLGLAGASGLLAASGSPLSGLTPDVSLLPDERPDDGHAAARAAEWDMSWVDRVTGKYRAVFDSPGVSDGAGVFRAVMWMNQYKEVYGTERSEMSPVVILRHTGTLLAMNDDYWTKYEVGKQLDEDDRRDPPKEGTPPRKNPLSGDAAWGLPKFLESGGIVLACNIAFGQAISRVRRGTEMTRDEATVAAKAMMFPGIILQPSGIFAALRAQEAGCHYILAG